MFFFQNMHKDISMGTQNSFHFFDDFKKIKKKTFKALFTWI